jgi:hypothetical protein
LEVAHRLPARLAKFDFRTHQLAEISDSEDMVLPAVSPDGKFLAALHTEATRVSIYEFHTGKWTILDEDSGYRPTWTKDSTAVYFINHKGEVRRCHAASRKVDSVVKIPASQLNFGVFGAFLEAFDFLATGPDDELLMIHDQRSSQIYAMKRQGW